MQCEAQVHSGVAPAQEQPFGLEYNLDGNENDGWHTEEERAVANRTNVSDEIEINEVQIITLALVRRSVNVHSDNGSMYAVYLP